MLIRECRSGDVLAFGRLYEAYRAPAYFVALQWVGVKEDALDVCSAAFGKAFSGIGRFDPGREFRPWLFTIVRNLCIDLLRRRGQRPQRSLGEGEDFPDPTDPGPLAAAEASDTRQRIAVALDALEAGHREIIMLKDFHDLSYKEIAEVLDIPLGTVMSRLNAARKKLRAALGGEL